MATVDRPLSMVLSDIMGNVQDIVRSEARLAKAEIQDELRKSGSAAVFIGAGVLMLLLSGLFVLLAIVYALSTVMPAWAASLIVAVGAGLVAAIFIGAGRKRMRNVRALPKTAATLKENVEWARQPSR